MKPVIKHSHLRPIVLAIGIAFSSIPTTSHATTYTVSNTNDSGVGSLRQALIDANNNTGLDTVKFSTPVGSVINLTSGELSITDTVIITGPEAGNPKSVILDAAVNSRLINSSMTTANKNLTLENLTLRNGYTLSKGGALYIEPTNIIQNTYLTVLNHVVVTDNHTGTNTSPAIGHGGGIYAGDIDLNLNNSIVSKNKTLSENGDGGGIGTSDDYSYVILNNSLVTQNSTLGPYSRGGGISAPIVRLYNSTVSNNTTAGSFASGGGISVGRIRMTQSTVSNNQTTGAYSAGGGIITFHSIILQSTISGNSISSNSTSSGGGLIGSGNTYISESTIINNFAPFGAGISIDSIGGTIDIKSSILSNNTIPFAQIDNFFDDTPNGTFFSNVQNSIFGDSLSEITGTVAYTTVTNSPFIGPLQFNGGITATHKPFHPGVIFTSPVIDKVSIGAFENTFDQRQAGFKRVINTKKDIGSVELQGTPNPNEIITRRDMVRELLKAKLGVNHMPSPTMGDVLSDIEIGDINAKWLEEFWTSNYTEGCVTNTICPNGLVSREEMAKIFLKVKNGANFMPTSLSNSFIDVPPSAFNAIWINELSDTPAYTQGCDTNKFCPKEPATRQWFNSLLAQLP